LALRLNEGLGLAGDARETRLLSPQATVPTLQLSLLWLASGTPRSSTLRCPCNACVLESLGCDGTQYVAMPDRHHKVAEWSSRPYRRQQLTSSVQAGVSGGRRSYSAMIVSEGSSVDQCGVMWSFVRRSRAPCDEGAVRVKATTWRSETDVIARPNVRAKGATTAGRQGPD
jgi:hypothetical protein